MGGVPKPDSEFELEKERERDGEQERERDGHRRHSLQLTSSEWSGQSMSSSHLQLPLIHKPLAHSNSTLLHVALGALGVTPAQARAPSSEPSEQSSSPSQAQNWGTHTLLSHWKEPWAQVGAGQEASSEPSGQSASSSQRKEEEMHSPLSQRNSPSVQFLATGDGRKGRGVWNWHLEVDTPR